jgi:hypothetical protein
MKNAFFAMVFSVMLGMGAAGCGSGSSSDKPDSGGGAGGAGGGGGDPMSQVCDKLEACQTLSTVSPGITTAADCKATAGAALSKVSASVMPTVNTLLTGCLEKADCAAFTECMTTLFAMMPKG